MVYAQLALLYLYSLILNLGSFQRYDYSGAMFSVRSSLLTVMLACSAGLAAENSFTLHGQLEPAVGSVPVYINGANLPYSAGTRSGSKSRFKFKKLAPGTYTVEAYITGVGEVNRSVVISSSLADEKGRIFMVMPSARSGEDAFKSMRKFGTVSVRQLSIPRAARKQYRKAHNRLNKHDVEGAITFMLNAVEIAPHYAEVWNKLGTIAYQSAEF